MVVINHFFSQELPKKTKNHTHTSRGTGMNAFTRRKNTTKPYSYITVVGTETQHLFSRTGKGLYIYFHSELRKEEGFFFMGTGDGQLSAPFIPPPQVVMWVLLTCPLQQPNPEEIGDFCSEMPSSDSKKEASRIPVCHTSSTRWAPACLGRIRGLSCTKEKN